MNVHVEKVTRGTHNMLSLDPDITYLMMYTFDFFDIILSHHLPPPQLISANVSTMGVNPLALDEVDPPLRVTFTYSAKWLPTKSVLYMYICMVHV